MKVIYCYSIGITTFFSLLTIILFYTKKRIQNEQTIIFTKLLILNFFGLINELGTMLYIYYVPNYNLLIIEILIKGYLLYTSELINQLTLYIFSICYEKDNNKYYKQIKAYSNGYSVIISIITLFLPVHLHDLYGYGPSVTLISLYSIINVIYWSISLFKNFKKFKKKVISPIYIFILLGIIAGVVQAVFPKLAIVTIIEFVIIYIIYLTMENTDYKMIKQLEAAKNKVNEAYDIKNDFLKNMSHEIRTPLNGIVGLAEDIKTYKEIIPAKMDEDATELIYYSGLLVDTISSIIDINKLDNKFIDINENNYDIRSIVTQVKKTLSSKFAATTNFNININDNIPILYGDEGHIRHIITKLLENSLETTTNGNIDLNIDIDDNPENPILKIVVKDEGLGIHDEILPYICDYNNENAKNSKYYNAKLALNMSIVKKLVEMLKGTMNIVSGYGQGTTVIIELPQKPGRRSK